jgi:hypothetical protein
MRSTAVFFSKRHAIRARPIRGAAEAKSRRSSLASPRAMRRASDKPECATRASARSRFVHAYRPRSRSRLLLLVPRGFVPLRTH